ncbi:vegetative protein [bacterium]|nr:vegetative protein [bacterium]
MSETCKVEKCKREYRAKGYCDAHYKKWKRGELPKSRYKTCHNENCNKKVSKSGLCEEHFAAVYGKKAGAAPAAEAPAAS